MAKIRLTESELKKIIRESVKSALINEEIPPAVTDFVHGHPLNPWNYVLQPKEKRRAAADRTTMRLQRALGKIAGTDTSNLDKGIEDSYRGEERFDQQRANDKYAQRLARTQNQFMNWVMSLPKPAEVLTSDEIKRVQEIVGTKVDGVWEWNTQQAFNRYKLDRQTGRR